MYIHMVTWRMPFNDSEGVEARERYGCVGIDKIIAVCYSDIELVLGAREQLEVEPGAFFILCGCGHGSHYNVVNGFRSYDLHRKSAVV